MSKVICDVCGTTYPETAAVCPICGCAKHSTEQTGADSDLNPESQAYAPVRGGRFSKSNVRRRNKAAKEPRRSGSEEPGDGVNKGLVAVVLILLLAIIAVLVYIGARVLFPGENSNPSENTSQNTEDPTPSGSEDPSGGPGSLACTDLKLSATTVELTQSGMVWMLSTEVKPADTTDKVTFVSSDPNVATVDENGKITAIGGGDAVITVTCGQITAQCNVKCSFGNPVDPTETTAPPVVVPPGFKLDLKYSDITISERYPNPVALFRDTASVKATDITWTVDNPEIASVNEKGVVSPVGKGNTVVRATFGDQTASCSVIVAFDPAEKPQAKYKLNKEKGDVTVTEGETFPLYLIAENGSKVQNVQWTASEEGFVEINGSNIKAIKHTRDVDGRYIVLSATVEDYTYTCKVRITKKEAEAT